MADWTKADFDRLYGVNCEPWGRPGYPNARPAITLHYHYWPIGQYQRNMYAPLLAQVCGMQAGDTVLLFGCGFNWTAQGLNDLGIEAIGVDVSTYINAEAGNTEEAEIRQALIAAGIDPDVDTIPDNPRTQQHGVAGMNYLDVYLQGGRTAPAKRGWGTIAKESLSNAGSRNRVAGLMSKNADFLVSEEVLNSVTDAEAIQALGFANTYMNSKGAPGWLIVHVLSPIQQEAIQQPDLNWKTFDQWRAFLDTNGYAHHKIVASASDATHRAYESMF